MIGRRTPKRIKRFLSRYGSVASLCDALTDPRKRRGTRWSFEALVDTLMLGMMLMCRTLKDVESASERAGRRIADSTLSYTLERIEPAPLRAALIAQIRRQQRAKAFRSRALPIGVCAIDGKTIWTGDHEADPECQRQSHGASRATWQLRVQRAVLTSAPSRPCIDQCITPKQTNDMGAFPAFFRHLHAAYGRSDLFELVTCDAGYTSKDNARLIDDSGVGYVLGVKGNQPTLHAEMQRVLASGSHAVEATTPWEKAHGTTMRRELYRTDALLGFDDWPHLRQGWLVRQITRHRDGRETVQDRYFISNLLWKRLTPHQILVLVRHHWAIENDCFHTLDVVWREDTHAWTTNAKSVAGRYPLRTMTWLRLLAYNLLTWMLRVHLRAECHRRMSWSQLRSVLEQVLLVFVPSGAMEVALAIL